MARRRRAVDDAQLELVSPTGDGIACDSWAPGQRPPRARRRDPASSHRAADELEASGRAARQTQAALAAVRAHPGTTTRDLANCSPGPAGMDGGAWLHALGRRLSDLRRRGAVQRTRLGTDDFRWWPVGFAIPRGVGELAE